MKSFVIPTVLSFLVSSCYAQPKTEKFVDYFSTTSCKVVPKKHGKALGHASGFFVQSKDSTVYFVTNNHVAGLEYFIDEYRRDSSGKIPPDSIIPDQLSVRIYDTIYNRCNFLDLDLFKNGYPLFTKIYEDESKPGSVLDIIVIPLNNTQIKRLNPKWILDRSSTENNMSVSPGTELFVVGFPERFGQTLYPIWKRGTVASEANLLGIGESVFCIDATTRKGMSGSPVFYRYSSLEGTGTTTTSRAYATYLVGIYSGQWFSEELGKVTRLAKVFDRIDKK